MMVERRVSMADVAAAAGVSSQTVSRVANGGARVDPVTRAAVERAMAALGYRVHRAARALRTGRTQTIGLIASTLATVGNSSMLQAVADAAASRGYALTVVTLGDGGDIAAAFERLADQGVDGAVVLNEASDLARGAGAPDDLRLVVVDSPRDSRFTVVNSDHRGGARAAVAHLLDLGHATVHHLAGPVDSFAAVERERGWREALAEAGAPMPEPLRGDWSAASGHRVGSVLAADPAVTAVFAANDQMALGLLRALSEAARSVPGEVSVVGFDDILDAADYTPPLTTVRQDFHRLAESVVTALVAGIEEGDSAGAEIVPAVLVARASTAAAPHRTPRA
jgi:DNA-binding LacI/PurR family transcriptional regulator